MSAFPNPLRIGQPRSTIDSRRRTKQRATGTVVDTGGRRSGEPSFQAPAGTGQGEPKVAAEGRDAPLFEALRPDLKVAAVADSTKNRSQTCREETSAPPPAVPASQPDQAFPSSRTESPTPERITRQKNATWKGKALTEDQKKRSEPSTPKGAHLVQGQF